MKKTNTAYLSLGSNLGNKLNHLQKAIFLLDEKAGDLVAISKIYQSASWGFSSDDFYNCCVSIDTTLTPHELLEVILGIEKELGRTRPTEKSYAARTIDIDIIYYEKEIVDTDTLKIPHPLLEERRFVLRPLADVAPQFYHPIVNKDTRNLIQQCRDKSEVNRTTIPIYKTREALFSSLHFIALEGNIGAGKTTLAKMISEDFNGKLVLEQFADNPFLPKFYNDQSRYAFPLEMSFLAERYQQFTDNTSQLDLFRHFMVSDYDIFKSLIFAKITLQEEEFKLYRRVFDFMYKEVTKPNVYVYLYQNTERLLDNIKKRGRSYEQNIQPDYLDKINRGYFDFMKSYPEQNSLVIDISELDFVAHQEDYKFILDKIQDFTVGQQY